MTKKKAAKKRAPVKKAPVKKKPTKELTPEQYHRQVLAVANAMTTKITATIDTDEIEAELRATKPRSPKQFAYDLFWDSVGKEDDITRRRKRRLGTLPPDVEEEDMTNFELPGSFTDIDDEDGC